MKKEIIKKLPKDKDRLMKGHSQIRQETETKMLNEFQDTEMKWLRQLKDCRKETLAELEKELPEERNSVAFETDDDASFEEGFNSCLSITKNIIENLKDKPNYGG